MPLKVRRLWVSCLILTAAWSGTAQAQETAQSSSGMASAATSINTPQQKISRVRALIAARNFVAAANELETIRRETGDEALQQVAQTMLIGVFLEQPDYVRAQALLEDSFKRNKTRKNGTDEAYFALAGQVIKGAQNQLERYKRLGLNIGDAKLPTEAKNDLERWHKMLETIIEQSKQMSVAVKQPTETLALLESAANARSLLSRDEYEAARWKSELDDTRELIANAQTKVEEVDASIQQPAGTTVATSVPPASVFKQPVETQKPVAAIPVSEKTSVPANVAQNDIPKPNSEPKSVPANQAPAESKPVVRERVAAQNIATSENTEKPAEKNDNASVAENAPKTEKSNEPMQVGSLVDAATRKVNPTYPTVARTARVSGIVKVEVVLDEEGSVAEVKNAAGPEMLKRAATEAVRRWKFKPFTRDGQPVRASGFVNFNFTL